MSTLRVNTLKTIDDSVVLDIKDLANAAGIEGPFGYNNVGKVESWSQLSTLIPNSAGDRVLLSSYYAGSDKGGGVFIAVAGEGTDNGGSVCVPNGSTTYYWQREITGKITPFMFGAYGDGVTDDSLYFSRALAAHNSLYVPSDSTFYINGEVTNSQSATYPDILGYVLEGDAPTLLLGPNGVISVKASDTTIRGLRLIPRSTTGTAISIQGSDNASVNHIHILDNYIGDPTSNNNYYFARAIYMKNCWYSTISGNNLINVPAWVGQHGYGIYSDASVNISVTRNTIMSFSMGIQWSALSVANHVNEGWMINNNIIIACTQALAFLDGLLPSVTNNIIDLIIGTGIAVNNQASGMVFANNWLSVAGNAITTSKDNPSITGNVISGNMLSSGTSTSAAINVTGGIEGMVSGNNVRGFSKFIVGNSTNITYWIISLNTLRDLTDGFSDLSYFPLSVYENNIHRGSQTDSNYTTPSSAYISRGKYRFQTTVPAVNSPTTSLTVDIPSGVIKKAASYASITPINVAADYIISYAPSESGATSAKFYVRNVAGENISAFSFAVELSEQ